MALIVEGSLPGDGPALLPATMPAWVVAGEIFGLGIGLVSRRLGVAGGEIITPTLVFASGLDIKRPGTASLLVSLPAVAVGIVRYAHRGAYSRDDLMRTVAPMGLGSVVGVILLYSSWHTFRRR